MTRAELNAELHNDPKSLGYGLYMPDSPGTVAEIMNAPTQSMIKAIASTTAQAWAAAGPYANIVDAGNNVSHPCRSSCLMLRDTLVSGVPIHMERQDVQDMFRAWVVNGVCTPTQYDMLYERANQPASRAEVLGLGYVTEEQVRKAWQL